MGCGSGWQLESMWKSKQQGSVWIVNDSGSNRGYFKFATPEQWHYSGTMVANELIAAQLARLLNIPVVELEPATINASDGTPHKGIVSREVNAQEVITWTRAGAGVHNNPERYVKRLDSLRALVVFDAWIANMDRATGKNLVLYRNDLNEKYNWYLIDHGLTLYGAPYKWEGKPYPSKYWRQLWQYYHVPKGLLRLQSVPRKLQPMIAKIESIDSSDIIHIVDEVPKDYLPSMQRDFIVRLLLDRQAQLRLIINRWLNYKGIKEYASDTAKKQIT